MTIIEYKESIEMKEEQLGGEKMVKYSYMSKTVAKQAIANVKKAYKKPGESKSERDEIIKHIIWEFEYQCPYSPRTKARREKSGGKRFRW